MHDWDDEASKRILGKCLKALKPNGRILLGERVIGASADFVSCFYDLHMLVLLGGRERTEAEFKGLFDAVGLRLTRIIRTNSPLSLVEGEAV